jgi:hypothetical protein
MQPNRKYITPKINSDENLEGDDSSTLWENTNLLNDGRPCVTQVWTEDGFTFITYYLSTLGLEEVTQNHLLNYLIQQGVKIPPELNELRVSTMKFFDQLNEECWSITIVVGESSN